MTKLLPTALSALLCLLWQPFATSPISTLRSTPSATAETDVSTPSQPSVPPETLMQSSKFLGQLEHYKILECDDGYAFFTCKIYKTEDSGYLLQLSTWFTPGCVAYYNNSHQENGKRFKKGYELNYGTIGCNVQPYADGDEITVKKIYLVSSDQAEPAILTSYDMVKPSQATWMYDFTKSTPKSQCSWILQTYYLFEKSDQSSESFVLNYSVEYTARHKLLWWWADGYTFENSLTITCFA